MIYIQRFPYSIINQKNFQGVKGLDYNKGSRLDFKRLLEAPEVLEPEEGFRFAVTGFPGRVKWFGLYKGSIFDFKRLLEASVTTSLAALGFVCLFVLGFPAGLDFR